MLRWPGKYGSWQVRVYELHDSRLPVFGSGLAKCMSDAAVKALGREARRLLRSRSHAALGTNLAGRPYVSLVAMACDSDGIPLLLLSDLAQHTRNLAADRQVSLLLEDTARHSDPLAGPRLTVIGTAERDAAPAALARFLARHPGSETYASFADFHLYRIEVERAHLVAGFGRISWIEAGELRGPEAPSLANAEPDIVAHMNADHSDALELYATRLLGRSGPGWRLTGIDPEGLDLRRDSETARLDFPEPVLTPAAARRMLVVLTQKARAAG
jgi:putative heme iron utilization protein